MLVNPVVSIYFFPVKTKIGNVSQTVWLNLVHVMEIQDLETEEKLHLHMSDQTLRIIGGESRLQLLEEIQVLRAKQLAI